MLELYHWEPNAACGRVMICLAEKGLAYEGRYLDLLAFEQHRPDFLALNPSGAVPVLVHDGAAYTESSYICEYLDEAFPARPLMPAAPLARWAVRTWQKYVDDALADAASVLAWQACGLPLPSPDAEAAAALIPDRRRRGVWRAALAGYPQERVAAAETRLAEAVLRCEAALGRDEWLAGPALTLADIAVFPYLNFLPGLRPAALADAPRTRAWLARLAARPAVAEALARGRAADPFRIAAPGPEPVRWG